MTDAICSKCKELKEIENIKFMLCSGCNIYRPKEKKKYQLKKVSPQGAKRTAEKKAAYKVMDETTEHICSGCGQGGVPLSHSHLIPVSLRKDLEADPENIVYDCLTIGNGIGCHDIWEHGTINERQMLLNYEYRMRMVFKKDIKYFHNLLLK